MRDHSNLMLKCTDLMLKPMIIASSSSIIKDQNIKVLYKVKIDSKAERLKRLYSAYCSLVSSPK